MQVQKIHCSFFIIALCFVGQMLQACGSDWLWESGQPQETAPVSSTTNKDIASDFPGISYAVSIQKIVDQKAEEKKVVEKENNKKIATLPKTFSMYDVTDLVRKKAPERDRASSVQLDQVESLVIDFFHMVTCTSKK